MCLSGRELTEPRLSPDGETVAFVVRWGPNSAIVSVPVAGGPERLVTSSPQPSAGRGLGGGCFDWLPDGRGVVYAASDGELWYQPFPGGPALRLSDVGDDRHVEAPDVSPGGDIVVAVIDQAEVWCWPLGDAGEDDGDGTDAPKRLDDGSADFVFDPNIIKGELVQWSAWNVPDMPWDRARVETLSFTTSERATTVGAGTIQQPRATPDGRRLAVRDDSGWLNVWLDGAPIAQEPYEHAGPTWGMGQRSYAMSPNGDRVAFTRNESGFGRLCVVDLATLDVADVARGVHGQLAWVGDHLTAVRSGARTATQVVSYDVSTWERTVLAVGPVAGWDQADLPEPELVEVEQNGLTLHARRYSAGNGRTLCWVHGGPTDQWQVGFMPRVAYWWSRGWDILVPDPRGSTGHGRDYQQALHGGWGVVDVDDTAAILQRSHATGHSASDRTVMMGSSSGGLTVLGVLGRHGGLAAGGVVLYPVADLVALAEESHRFEAHYTESLVGPLSDAGRYEGRSPLSYADAIDVPLLVMHGDADPVVPISSTVALVDVMRRAGRDVEFVVMEGEGHGFRDPVNKRADYLVTESFLRRVLGQAAR